MIFDTESIIITISVGILGFTALSLNVIGYQQAEATQVAWLEFILIIFEYMYQIFLFNDAPNALEIIGIVLVIIGSSISIMEAFYRRYYLNKNNETNEYELIPDKDENQNKDEV